MNEKSIPTPKKSMNKTEVLAALSEATGLTKQQVSGLFDELVKRIGKNVGDRRNATRALGGVRSSPQGCQCLPIRLVLSAVPPAILKGRWCGWKRPRF